MPVAGQSGLTSRQGSLRAQDLYQLSTGVNLQPGTLTAAIAAANRGAVRSLVEIVEDICERDLHLSGILQTRRSALAGKPVEVRPTPNRLGKRIARELQDLLERLRIGEVLGQLQGAVVHPLCWHEILWDYSEGQWDIAGLEWCHPKRATWITSQTTEGALGELRLLTDASPTYGERLKEDHWLVHQLRVRDTYPWRLGLGRALSLAYLYKTHAVKWWSQWVETCATPAVVGKITGAVSDAVAADLQTALETLGNSARAVLPEGTDLQWAGAPGGGDQAYQRNVDSWNSEMSKAVLGHSGAADETPGKLGGSQTAELIWQSIVDSDEGAAAATLRWQLAERYVRLNYGPDEAVPEIQIKVDPQASREQRVRLAKETWSMGLPISRSWLASVAAVEVTDDPKDALPPPGPQGSAQVAAGVVAPQPAADQAAAGGAGA